MNKTNFQSKIIVRVLLFLLFTSISNSQDITGSLTGHVHDTLGAAVTGVNISVQSDNLQGVKGTATDNNGFFRIFNLPPGNYNIRVSSVGYGEVLIENIQIRLGKTTNLGEIKLVQQTYNLPEITVSGEKQVIDPSSTSYGGNLRSKDFEKIPLDRNYKNIITLLPQANTSYYGDEANLGGATGFENKYFVDGVEVTDPLIGASGTNLPYNFIQEIDLKEGGYDAGSRGALGGLLNVVTYSGSNQFHGSVFGFYTSNKLTENQKQGTLDITQGDFSNYDAGFGLGGPIVYDNLWFYAAYNPSFNRHDVDIPGFGTSTDKTLINSFAAKLNWKASDELKFVFTATGDPTERDAVGRDIGIPPAAIANSDMYFQNIYEGGVNLALNSTYNITKDFFFEGSISRVDRHDTGVPATETGRNEILFQDFLKNLWSGGPASSWDSYRHSTTGRIDGTILLADHLLSAGFAYKTNSVNNIYDYHSFQRYDSVYYGESIGKGFGEVYNRIPSVFVQDSWKVLPVLNLNFGIRWDNQSIVGSDGKVAQRITTPVQPRIGFVFLPADNASQRIFGSFGRYAQEFGLFQSVNYQSGDGYDYYIYFDHDPRINNTGGDTVYNSPHVIRPAVDGLRGQYYDEFNLGYEILVGWNTRLSFQGLYRTLREAIDDAWLASENRYQLGNPGRGILSEWPEPQRDYTALIISIERRLDEHFNFLASYVLSRDYGNYEGLFDAVYHSQFPNANSTFNDLSTSRLNTKGLVPDDRTHVFKFSGSYSFSFGLITGISFIAQSGTPLSEIAFTDYGVKFLSQRGSAGRTPAIWDLSARLIYYMPILSSWQTKIILDAFHIASQRKPVDIDQQEYRGIDGNGNPVDPNPTYGQVYRYQPSMSIRLGLEVSF